MEKEQQDAIKELAQLLHENNLSEIDYEANGVHIRIVGPKAASTEISCVAPVQVPAVREVSVPAGHENKPVAVSSNDILSPMVGIVYLSKDPQSPAFVKPGDKVSVGQTICLVEAMKTFNPIKSTKDGVIKEVLVENGSPVEFNQPLFSLE